QDSGDVTQYLIASLMSVGVIDLLEIVQIDLQNSELRGCRHREGSSQPHIQATSVEKSCQCVLGRQARQLLGQKLVVLSLRDVAHDTLQRGWPDWFEVD